MKSGESVNNRKVCGALIYSDNHKGSITVDLFPSYWSISQSQNPFIRRPDWQLSNLSVSSDWRRIMERHRGMALQHGIISNLPLIKSALTRRGGCRGEQWLYHFNYPYFTFSLKRHVFVMWQPSRNLKPLQAPSAFFLSLPLSLCFFFYF